MFSLQTTVWVSLALTLANSVAAVVPVYGQCGGSGWTGMCHCTLSLYRL
jgi:hypothetical protein